MECKISFKCVFHVNECCFFDRVCIVLKHFNRNHQNSLSINVQSLSEIWVWWRISTISIGIYCKHYRKHWAFRMMVHSFFFLLSKKQHNSFSLALLNVKYHFSCMNNCSVSICFLLFCCSPFIRSIHLFYCFTFTVIWIWPSDVMCFFCPVCRLHHQDTRSSMKTIFSTFSKTLSYKMRNDTTANHTLY